MTNVNNLKTCKVIPMPISSGKRKNLHIVLGEERMCALEERCNEVDVSKSEVGRLLIEAFIAGAIEVEAAKATVVKNKIIKKRTRASVFDDPRK